MKEYAYDRNAAVAYARKWAYRRNPAYYDFSGIGGDCTNYASQCIYAGCGVMNTSPLYGWFYFSTNDRTPSWTGVEFLHNFLVANDGRGPFAVVTGLDEAEIGDVVQLGNASGGFYHSPVVVEKRSGRLIVAAHSYDVLDKPLDTYNYAQTRVLHILGYRK